MSTKSMKLPPQDQKQQGLSTYDQILKIRVLLQLILTQHITKFKEVRKKIEDKKALEARKGKFLGFQIFSVASTKQKMTDVPSSVMRHWDIEVETEDVNDLKTKAVLVIQVYFRVWLLRKRAHLVESMLDNIAAKHDSATVGYVIVAQSAIRGWTTKQLFDQKLKERQRSDKVFDEFCFLIKYGIKLSMYSHKFRTMKTRRFQLDQQNRNLQYRTSRFLIHKIDLRALRKITRGISVTRPNASGRCFCLHLNDHRIIDLEASDIQLYNILMAGFERLINFMTGDAPFFMITFDTRNDRDENNAQGVPYKAGPSIIEYALQRHIKRLAVLDQMDSLRDNAKKQPSMRAFFAARHSQLSQPLTPYNRRSTGASAYTPNNNISISNDGSGDIEYHDICHSRADEQRLYNAMKALQMEYGRWAVEADAEAAKKQKSQSQGQAARESIKVLPAHLDTKKLSNQLFHLNHDTLPFTGYSPDSRQRKEMYETSSVTSSVASRTQTRQKFAFAHLKFGIDDSDEDGSDSRSEASSDRSSQKSGNQKSPNAREHQSPPQKLLSHQQQNNNHGQEGEEISVLSKSMRVRALTALEDLEED